MGANLLETRNFLLTTVRAAAWACAGIATVAGCSMGSADGSREATATSAQPLASTRSRLVPWGDGAQALGLRPALAERAAFGVPAIAVAPGGEVLVLDAVKQRVVRLGSDALTSVASVPLDADDLAVAGDGALAVHRQMSPHVVVLSPAGERLGDVDATAAGDVDSIVLGPSRRVVARSAYQETFQLGSPSLPQLPAATLRTRRVGAELLANGDGLVTVVKDGVAELRVVAQATEDAHAEVRAVWPLGAASSAHLVGVTGLVACLRLEHVTQAPANGALDVSREAVCLDVASGVTLLRAALAPPGLYVPRRELAFARGVLAYAHPEPEGLRITTWAVTREGGAR
ncbi:MAG: hypothetical protein JWP97_2135 [Labilithrix sp.]|nr:hypothetical protein [Labilithrix sp.]